MSGSLSHNPAKIVRQLLIDLLLGTDPDDNLDWPAYYSQLPDSPNNVIAVMQTDGITEGRTHVDGVTQEHYGIQFLVRNTSVTDGDEKARAIADAMDTQVLQTTVTLDSVDYNVQAITRVGQPIPLGTEGATSRRRLFSLNTIADINVKA